MEMTHVIRGEDHISNTPRQILLYEALGFTPPAFAHLALVMGPDHTPLSKRHGATSVAEFRSKGYLPEALVNYLALIGWSPGGGDELLPVEELARRFSLERRRPERRRVRRREAGVGEPALSEAWPTRAARRARRAVSSSRRASSIRPIADGSRVSRLGDADGDGVGRSARSGAATARRSCSTYSAEAALADDDDPSRDADGRCRGRSSRALARRTRRRAASRSRDAFARSPTA